MSPGGNPIAGVTVNFYNTSNALVGTATSRANGYWDTILGTDAVKCDVDGTTVTNTYYPSFTYNLKIFQVIKSPLPICRVPLPTIVAGQQTTMPGGSFVFFLSSQPPPPPPTGCIP